MSTPINIVDVIALPDITGRNIHYYVVVDRAPRLVYERRPGGMLVAADEGFYDVLQIEPGSTRAFAGREFDIALTDGTTLRAKGQVWSSHIKHDEPTIEVGVATLEQLAQCYVFFGGTMSRAKLDAWLAVNTPSKRYNKHDPRETMEAIDARWSTGDRKVCAERARVLRRRGVRIFKDAASQRSWSPSYERRRAKLLADLALDAAA